MKSSIIILLLITSSAAAAKPAKSKYEVAASTSIFPLSTD